MTNMAGGAMLPVMFFASPLPQSDLGILFTLWLMRGRVRAEKVHPLVRRVATDIVRDLDPRDPVGHVHAIRDYVDQHSQFLRDPDGVELLHGPVWQLRQLLTRGRVLVDCDDIAMLTAALGGAIGLKARFVVVGFGGPHAPYRHVWTELRSPVPGAPWVDMDLTRAAQDLDTMPVTRRLIWGA